MGTIWFTVWSLLIIIVQASDSGAAEEPTCTPGFESNWFIFKVTREQLRRGSRLGKVNLTECTDRTNLLFVSHDDHFMVQTDGTLVVRRQVVVHEERWDFFVHTWDSQGQKMIVPVTVLLRGHGKDNPQNQLTEEDKSEVSILHFHKSNKALSRRKRDWVIPPLSIAENHRGPFPLFVAKVRSTEDRVKKIIYSITGAGADQPPVGLFTMNRETGSLYVTQSLDREKMNVYQLQAHAAEEGSTDVLESMDITVNVIDMNDNKPVFKMATFTGEVAESSLIDFEVTKIEASDADLPDSDNSDIRYSIVSQEPQEPSPSMFTINPITGAIRVNAIGFDRNKYPQYTLQVRAADLKGEGLPGYANVIISVTDKDGVSLSVPAPQTNWIIPDIAVSENFRGPYPLILAQVRSTEDRVKKIIYSITGAGADQPPVGLFTMNRETGSLHVTQPLDRETQEKYTLQLQAVAEMGGTVEGTTEIVVRVVDQNDNRPVFNKDTHTGQVAEGSPKGFEVIKVEASDADEPNTDNSEIRYRIMSQEPQEPDPSMFTIDRVTGVISVNADGLDRQKHHQYTLVVEAGDMDGEGLRTQTSVIVTVTAKA